jgi:hypothetical protein
MTGSRAEDIIGDFFESDDWGELVEPEGEPDVELPATPPPEAA